MVLNLITPARPRHRLFRDNRIAAESVGISATKYKMMAFVSPAAPGGHGAP